MKKGDKFLEKYGKWIVRISIIIGMLLIFKLWATSLFIEEACGGGWINLCVDFSIEYYWISASYIAILFFVISIFLILKIKQQKNNIINIIFAIFILFLGLIGKQVFFLVSPDFKFYLTPATKQYKNENNELIDLDLYLELTTKYCDNFKEGDNFKYKYTRESMCSGKFEPNLNTVDEYIKVLGYANKYNFKYLYWTTFRWADDNVGLEKLIKQYNDDTFYAYVIYKGELNKEKRDLFKKIVDNNNIIDMLDFYNISIENHQKIVKEDKFFNSDKYWKNFDIKLKEKIKQIKTINQKLF